MRTPVFLTHFDPAGAQKYIPLDRCDTTPTFYLPDIIVPDINVSTKRDSKHFNIRLDIERDHCLLSVYSNEIQPVIVLGDLEIELPVSTSAHQKSFILTEEHQFITPISRWQVQWDRSGVISNSMRPPPKSFSEMQSDEEHVRQLELLPSMGGKTLVDRQKLDDVAIDEESGRARMSVEEIHLSPKSSAALAEGVEPESGAQIDSTWHKMISHPDSGGRDNTQPMNVGYAAAFLAIFEEEEKELKEVIAAVDRLSANVSEVPESPSSFLSQNSVEEEGRGTSILLATLAHRTLTPADSLDKTLGLQDRARLQTSIQINERLNIAGQHVDTGKEVEPSGSEDESQLQKDKRIPKRRLSEIEDEELPVKRKMTKADDEQFRYTTREKHGGSEIAIQIVEDAAKTSVVVEMPPISVAKPSTEKDTMSLPRTKGKQSQIPIIPAHYSAIVQTPVRRSSRKSETPASSSAAARSGLGRGRPKVVFSSASEIPKKKNVLQTIEKLGGTVVDDIDDADVLCTGSGTLKKTSKFIIAIVRGIDIVTDDWVRQARKDQSFPPCENFLPKDRNNEKKWGFSLSRALKRGRGKFNFLDGVDLYLTAQVRKDLGNLAKDLEHVAFTLGAVHVRVGLPSKKSKEERTLVIGSTKNVDPEGAKVNQLGHKLCTQDLLTMGVLRGKLEIDSNEFVIDVPVKDEPTSSQ